MFTRDSGPEAKQWLERNRNPSAFASNRFGTTENAIAFVAAIYDAGASYVLIPKDSICPEMEAEEGGPYADAMVIDLEATKDTSEVIRLYKDEAVSEGYDLSAENPVVDGRWLYMWWD
jgi:hypothetical protein